MMTLKELRQLLRLSSPKEPKVSIKVRYGDWTIRFDPPPIPVRNCDWAFVHEDFDGAPDSNDNRCGYGESPEDCIERIYEIEGSKP